MQCCICEKSLPNRYAVAGRCREPGCEAPFCALHWRQQDGWCPTHQRGNHFPEVAGPTQTGADSALPLAEPDLKLPDPLAVQEPSTEQPPEPEEASPMKKSFLTRSLDRMKQRKIEKSPEGILAGVEMEIQAKETRKSELKARMIEVEKTIHQSRAAYQSASPAEKRRLEPELKNLLIQHGGFQKEWELLLEQEQHLQRMAAKIRESLTYGERKLDLNSMEKLADQLEDQALDAEDLADMSRELDRAGERREQAEAFDLEEALAAFDPPESSPVSPVASGTKRSPESTARSVREVPEKKESSPPPAAPEDPLI